MTFSNLRNPKQYRNVEGITLLHYLKNTMHNHDQFNKVIMTQRQ